MSSLRTLSLSTLTLLAICGTTACSSSTWPTEPVTPANDGGGPGNTDDASPGPGPADDSGGGNGDDAGNPGTGKPDSGVKPGKDSGMPSSGDSGGGASCPVANLPADWQNSAANQANNTACNACMAQYCCDSITSCANDTGCKAIYDCQSNCYNADASAAQMNTCTAACVMGSATSQGLFNSQDSCVNTTNCASTTTCGS